MARRTKLIVLALVVVATAGYFTLQYLSRDVFLWQSDRASLESSLRDSLATAEYLDIVVTCGDEQLLPVRIIDSAEISALADSFGLLSGLEDLAPATNVSVAIHVHGPKPAKITVVGDSIARGSRGLSKLSPDFLRELDQVVNVQAAVRQLILSDR